MAEMNDIVKLAIDSYKGNVEKYSVAQSQDVLRQALIEANNGKTYLDYKDIRDGKCNGLFALVETILDRLIVDGFQENNFFMDLVDFRNVAEGDENVFVVEDADLFEVADIANGTQGIRRQRLMGPTTIPVPTVMKALRIYEELNRILAGRVDFNRMIERVGLSFRQMLLNDVYDLWHNAVAADIGGTTFFPAAGSYNEATLLTLIEHVEAASGGKPVTLVGTKAALRNLAPSITSTDANNDLYHLGYYGNFYGSNVVAIPQRHVIGGTTFAYDDKMITVIASDEKPLKVGYEGDPIVIMGNPLDKADFTQEYFYGAKWGTALVLAGGNSGIGRYQLQ